MYKIEGLKSIPKDARMRILVDLEVYDINHPPHQLDNVCHGFFDKQQESTLS